MEFKELGILDVKKRTVADINRLLPQLSDKAKKISKKKLTEIIDRDNMKMFVAIERGKIVGTASVYFRQTIMRKTGLIEDVVVDSAYRGKGIGRKLTEALIKEARAGNTDCVELTSKPERIAANTMYEKFGFIKRKTNFYRLTL